MTPTADTDRRHTILLGGVGGDSHSVGLTILRQALTLNGYRVVFLGPQNRIEDFFAHGGSARIAMVSTMDGHARYYLREFPELMQRFQPAHTRWYLGGNLTVGADALSPERHFAEMGFHRVFPRFVDVDRVLECIAADLAGEEPAPVLGGWQAPVAGAQLPRTVPDDRPVDDEAFRRERREVLAMWPTGAGAADLRENAAFLARVPSFAEAQRRVREEGLPPIVQPRCGVALIRDQMRQLRTFKGAGARVLSYQVDSLTRAGEFAQAQEALAESRRSGGSTLNGIPLINYGVGAVRRMTAAIGLPMQTRHSARDPRLLAEVSFAGGASAFEGGAISYNVPYYKAYPLEESIRNWQYVDALAGRYRDQFGIVLDREFFGVLTGTLVPPCIAIVANLLEAILAVRQGVRCVSLGYAEQGHRWQDVAAVRVLRQAAADVLSGLGYRDVQVNTVFHQYMAAFPRDGRLARELIRHSGATAALAGATRIIVKTPAEAFNIPAMVDNLEGMALAMRGVEEAKELRVDEERVAVEMAILRREVDALFDSVLVCGGGDVARGIVKAFETGCLDVPFAPSLHNRGLVVTARDAEGAVRFLSPGNLRLDAETREFHADRMRDRRRGEGAAGPAHDYRLVERDVMRIPRGEIDRWPLFG